MVKTVLYIVKPKAASTDGIPATMKLVVKYATNIGMVKTVLYIAKKKVIKTDSIPAIM